MSIIYGKNALYIKSQNELALKTLLYRKGPLSRTEIAAELSLSPPTITNIVGDFIRQGLMAELPETKALSTRNAGRRPIKVDYVPGARLALGIAPDRQLTRWQICDLRGNVVCQGTQPALAEDSAQALTQLAELLSQLRRQPELWGRLLGICLAVSHTVDPDRCRLFAQKLSEGAGLPVCCESGVAAQAHALQLFRPELLQDAACYAFCSLGRRVECPVFFVNADGLCLHIPGELGRMTLDAAHVPQTRPAPEDDPGQGTPRDRPFAAGSLDACAGLDALLDICGRALEAGQAPVLARLCPGPRALTPQLLWKARQQGDPLVCRTVEHAMVCLGIALANMVCLVHPQRIFLSGQAFRDPQNLHTLRESFDRRLPRSTRESVVFHTLDPDEYGAAHGACSIVLRRFFLQSGLTPPDSE